MVLILKSNTRHPQSIRAERIVEQNRKKNQNNKFDKENKLQDKANHGK